MKQLLCFVLSLLMLLSLAACATTEPTAPPATEPPSSLTQENSTEQAPVGTLWAKNDSAPDATLDLSARKALLTPFYSPVSGDTLFSGTVLSRVTLYAEKAGTLTLSSLPKTEELSSAAGSSPVTLTLKEGENTLPLSLTVPYGETLLLGAAGDTAVLKVSSAAESATEALCSDGSSLSICGSFYISSRVEKLLTGVDLEKEIPLGHINTDGILPDEAPVVFANDFFSSTHLTKLKLGVWSSVPGDIFTLRVVKLDVCGGQSIRETLSTHSFTATEAMEDGYQSWDCDITVPEGYTLAFAAENDSGVIAYVPGKLGRTAYDRSMGFFVNCDQSANYSGMRNFLLAEVTGTSTETAEECAARLTEEAKAAPLTEAEKAELKGYLSGKSLSLLGDSITTYADVSNNTAINSTIGGNAVYYSPTERLYLGHTWWKRLMTDAELTLCVNNSWSGSLILGGNGNIWSGRSENLHIDTDYAAANGIKAEPDLILVWMGTNDYNGNAVLGDPAKMNADLIREENGSFVYAEPTTVTEAYAVSLHKLRQRYPEADVLLMSPFSIKGKNDVGCGYLTTFNAALKAVGESFAMPFIDLSKDSGITLDNNASYTHGDGLHPNEEGMALISTCVERALLDYYRNQK